MTQESEYKYDPGKKLFVKHEIDPLHGVETFFEGLPTPDNTHRRKDVIDSKGLTRDIQFTRHQKDNPFSDKIWNSIARKDTDTSVRYFISYRKGESPGSLFVDVEMPPALELDYKFTFDGDRINSLRSESKQTTTREEMASPLSKPLNENMDFLIGTAKLRGLAIFGGILMLDLTRDKSIDTSEEFVQLMMMQGSLGLLAGSHSSIKSSKEIYDYLYKTAERAQGELVPFQIEEFANKFRDEILLGISLATMEEILNAEKDIDTLSDEEFQSFVARGAGRLVQYYMYHSERSNNIRLWYQLGKPEGIELSANYDTNSNSHTLSYGETFQLDGKKYTVSKKGDLTLVEFENPFRSTKSTVTIPSTINSSEAFDSMTTDQNTGWERVFDLVPVEISFSEPT